MVAAVVVAIVVPVRPIRRAGASVVALVTTTLAACAGNIVVDVFGVAGINRRIVVVLAVMMSLPMSMWAPVMVPRSVMVMLLVVMVLLLVVMVAVAVVPIFVVMVMVMICIRTVAAVLHLLARILGNIPPGSLLLVAIQMLCRLQKLLRNVEAVLQGQLAQLLRRGHRRSRRGAHGDVVAAY